MHARFRFRPLPMILLAALMLAACQPTTIQPVWEESFETGEAWHFASDAGAEIAVDEGRMTIRIRQPQEIAWATTDYACGRCMLEVEATALDGPADNEFGLLVHVHDDETFYAFGVSSDGYGHAARYEAGEWVPLRDWEPTACVATGIGVPNHLVLTVDEGDFTLAVGDCEVLRLHDEALAEGTIGLYAGSFDEGGVLVAFDNLRAGPIAP